MRGPSRALQYLALLRHGGGEVATGETPAGERKRRTTLQQAGIRVAKLPRLTLVHGTTTLPVVPWASVFLLYLVCGPFPSRNSQKKRRRGRRRASLPHHKPDVRHGRGRPRARGLCPWARHSGSNGWVGPRDVHKRRGLRGGEYYRRTRGITKGEDGRGIASSQV